jgi:hypothetical protein
MSEPLTPQGKQDGAPATSPASTGLKSYRDINIIEMYFNPPMAIGRLGGAETPLENFTWTEDPTIEGAAPTVIEPDITLEVAEDGTIRPYLPGAIRFREGRHFRPVAPFFELWMHYQDTDGKLHDEPLTLRILKDKCASTANLAYTVTAANRKAARRCKDDACSFVARIEVAGDDYQQTSLAATSPNRPSTEPLVGATAPIPLGRFRVIRPVLGNEMGVNLSVCRVRFTPARGEVYGPPGATEAPAPDTERMRLIVKPVNRILNPRASWTRYDADYSKFDNPEPSDTYDGADIDANGAWGVVDDTCDATIEASLVIGHQRWRSQARVFVGPPDFAPDRRPFVSLADDLADRELSAPPTLGPTDDELSAAEEIVADLLQRVFETASLTNLDATRRRAINENRGLTNPAPNLPKLDAASMTKRDRPYAELSVDLDLTPTPRNPIPYADLVRDAHAKLADLDLLVEYLQLRGDHVRELLRPAYGSLKELDENPGDVPKPTLRDPRVERDRAHDMRMPPYMRDSDATSLSLTRRQYLQVLALINRLQEQYKVAADAAERPADRSAMLATFAMRRGKPLAAKAEGIHRPEVVLDSPIRRRVRKYLDKLRNEGPDAPSNE